MPYKGLGHRKKVRDRYKDECCMSNAMKRIMRKWRKFDNILLPISRRGQHEQTHLRIDPPISGSHCSGRLKGI